MAKKITLSFTGQPIIDDLFGYGFTLNSLPILVGGFDQINVQYYTNPVNGTPFYVSIKPTLSETIDNTLAFLIYSYPHPSLSYKRVGDTIEMIMNIDDVVVSYTRDTGANFSLSIEDVVLNEDFNLRYYFEYDNVDGERYLCKINKKEYNAGAIEIQGKATITKGTAKDHLDSFRGTGLDIELEATNQLTLSDLYTDDERTFTVRFYKNDKLIFRGFLKPDGIFESFVRDRWLISLECVDGLGTLENLSFVKENGTFFVGKMKAFDIVYFCLNRIGIKMKINTFINTYYEGLVPSDTLDPLQKVYLIADRFVRVDNNTIMSCDEVLKSVLDIFNSVITQVNGEWYIYNPNELFKQNYPKFRRYSELGIYQNINQLNIGNVLGSQIDNYYPHHCGGNQKKEIKGAVSAFRLGYKYGNALGLLLNPSFDYSGSIISPYNGWALNFPDASGLIYLDPTNEKGLNTKIIYSNQNLVKLATSASLSSVLDFEYVIKGALQVVIANQIGTASYSIGVYIAVRIGIYYLNLNGEWVTTPTNLEYKYRVKRPADDKTGTAKIDLTFDAIAQPLPISGDLFIEIYTVKGLDTLPPLNPDSPFRFTAEFTDINILPTENTTYVGEFHTVERTNRVSSLIKESKTVYNGDRTLKEYIGDIFKDDLTTSTSLWFRKGSFETYPILRISAENTLRIAQKPLVVFSGDVKGYLPYLSVTTINNVPGKYMPIEWQHDTMRNITKIKYLELYAEEISDIVYTPPNYDYGNTVKPTIKG